LQNQLNSPDFIIEVLHEAEFGDTRSPAHARNIGIMRSHGDYLLLLDADNILLDKKFIAKVIEELGKAPWVAVKLVPVIMSSSLIERTQFLEELSWVRNISETLEDVLGKRYFPRDYLTHVRCR